MMVNKVILIGRLTRDPELRYSASGAPVCHFSLATDSGFGERMTTYFADIVVFGKQAESCAAHLKKGGSAYVEGQLKSSEYMRDGQKQRKTEIIARDVKFLGGRPSGSSGGPREHAGAPPTTEGSSTAYEHGMDDEPF